MAVGFYCVENASCKNATVLSIIYYIKNIIFNLHGTELYTVQDIRLCHCLIVHITNGKK